MKRASQVDIICSHPEQDRVPLRRNSIHFSQMLNSLIISCIFVSSPKQLEFERAGHFCTLRLIHHKRGIFFYSENLVDVLFRLCILFPS